MTIDSYPHRRKDSKASIYIYIYLYDDEKKYTRRRVTKWENTREGKSEAKKFLKKIQPKMQDEKFMQVFKRKIIEVRKLFEGFEQFKKDHSNSTLSCYNLVYNHF